jgi:hypothetical protein
MMTLNGMVRRWSRPARLLLLTGALSTVCLFAKANLVDIGASNITPAASVITFDGEDGVTNPTFTFANIPGIGSETVSFGGIFTGQKTVTNDPVVTLSNSKPTGPLSLDLTGPPVTVTDDADATTNPVLSGTPTFNGPISIFFSKPVTGVALTGGFFDNVNSTSVEAFDAAGNSLGILSNNTTGFEFYGLADSTGKSVISGLSFYVTGNEPAGFEIDNVTFGASSAFAVPEVNSFLLLGIGLVALVIFQRKRLLGA